MGPSSDTSDALEFTFGTAAIQSPNSPLNRLSGRAPTALPRGKVTIGSPGKLEPEADHGAAITTPVSFCSGGGMTDGAPSATGTPESRAGADLRRPPDVDDELLRAAPTLGSSSMADMALSTSPPGKARHLVDASTGEVPLNG